MPPSSDHVLVIEQRKRFIIDNLGKLSVKEMADHLSVPFQQYASISVT